MGIPCEIAPIKGDWEVYIRPSEQGGKEAKLAVRNGLIITQVILSINDLETLKYNLDVTLRYLKSIEL